MKYLSIKLAIFIAAVISTLLVSAKGTMTQKRDEVLGRNVL